MDKTHKSVAARAAIAEALAGFYERFDMAMRKLEEVL